MPLLYLIYHIISGLVIGSLFAYIGDLRGWRTHTQFAAAISVYLLSSLVVFWVFIA